MSELILELYTEEIPALMQKKAEEAYRQIFEKAFGELGIAYNLLELYLGPRRLTLHMGGLPANLPAKNIELKGPKLGALEAAIEGFCKSNNIAKSDLIVKTVKDQACYVYEAKIPASSLTEILPSLLTKAISEYSWPKSMYWGSYDIKWVRPLLNLMCLFDGKVLDMSYGHLKANNLSFGHRFIAHDSFAVSSWQDYRAKLQNTFVILSRDERLELIRQGIEKIELENNIFVDIDGRLLEEVAGLAEHISVLIGRIPEKFMSLPCEILVTSMRTHQRYFPTRSKDDKFAPYFVFVSNLPATGATEIVSGNEKVLSARLSDAVYFYAQDKKIPLESRVKDLSNVVFHAKIGTMYNKADRLVKLAEFLQPKDAELAKAALVCKADLVTEAVGEFPELQGIMGSYYAASDGFSSEVVDSIKNHYRPLGNDDEVPTGKAAYLALADKMDSLVGLMLAGERATGSKDPYALRRYALGIIKIILNNKLKGLNEKKLIGYAADLYNSKENVNELVLQFIEERLKHYLKDRFDQKLVNAAIDLDMEDDLSIALEKIEYLQKFMISAEGEVLLQIYRRVSNILGNGFSGTIDKSKLLLAEEKSLHELLSNIIPQIDKAIAAKDFSAAIASLVSLKPALDNFFDNVMINDADISIANNRKAMLQLIADAFSKIAHFEQL